MKRQSKLERARAQAAQDRERRIAAVCKRLEKSAVKKEVTQMPRSPNASSASSSSALASASSSISKTRRAKRKRTALMTRPLPSLEQTQQGAQVQHQKDEYEEEAAEDEDEPLLIKRKRLVDLTYEDDEFKTPPTRIKLNFDEALHSQPQEKRQRVHIVDEEYEEEDYRLQETTDVMSDSAKCSCSWRSTKHQHSHNSPPQPRYLSYSNVDRNKICDQSASNDKSSQRLNPLNKSSTFQRDASLLFSRSMDSSFTGKPSNAEMLSTEKDFRRASRFRSKGIVSTESSPSLLDLESVEDLSRLETVEGTEILHTMLTTRSSRPKHATSLLQGRKHHSPVNEREILLWQHLRKQRMQQKPHEDSKRTSAEPDPEIKYEEPEPSVERGVHQFGRTNRLRWWNSFVWCSKVLALLIACVAVAAKFSVIWKPAMPFCDSKHVDVELVQSHAVQLFTGAECRSCPMFGLCSEGSLVGCVEPFELKHELCVESSEVQKQILMLAGSLEEFVVRKASHQVATLPVWASKGSLLLQVPLSEMRHHAETVAVNMRSISSLPSAHVINRAVEIALSELKDVMVGSDELLSVGTGVLPWFYRVKLLLVAHSSWLCVVAILLGASGVLYFHLAAHRVQSCLVERLMKEVRFFLLTRLQQAEQDESCVACFPADYLRDLLLESLVVTPMERRLVRKRVWPRIVAMAGKDPHIRIRKTKIHGEQMDVWEWRSAGSRRQVASRHRAHHRLKTE